jgi:hypothetical protein
MPARFTFFTGCRRGPYFSFFLRGSVPAQPISNLSETQKLILECCQNFPLLTASALAREFCFQTHIPESTFWHNLRRLKKMGMIDFGNSLPIRLRVADEELGKNNQKMEVKIQEER